MLCIRRYWVILLGEVRAFVSTRDERSEDRSTGEAKYLDLLYIYIGKLLPKLLILLQFIK